MRDDSEGGFEIRCQETDEVQSIETGNSRGTTGISKARGCLALDVLSVRCQQDSAL